MGVKLFVKHPDGKVAVKSKTLDREEYKSVLCHIMNLESGSVPLLITTTNGVVIFPRTFAMSLIYEFVE